jgi:predicted MFS family arabinose efflux permease
VTPGARTTAHALSVPHTRAGGGNGHDPQHRQRRDNDVSESSLSNHATTHEHQSRLQRGTVLAVASISQFMVVLDVTIISYFFLSLYLQNVKHYSPLRAGLAFLPMGLMTFAGALVASRLVKRLGIRRQLVIAPLVTAAAVFWLSHLTAHSSYRGSLLVPLLLVGASIGVTFVPMTMAATMGVPPAESGLASGLLNTSRQVGGALGLAVLATIATAATHHADGLGAPHLVALTQGYTRGFLVIAAISVLGAVSAAFLSASTPCQDGRAAAPDESQLIEVTV